jgi:2-hydroxycyclohexanecarboxyl-CoA dehydrogenase
MTMSGATAGISGQTVVITGAGSGIGHAIALGFLRDGARVVGCDIREEGLARLAEKGALVQRTDVRSREQVAALIERARAETGRLDVLFNNAGFGSRKPVAELDEGELERMIEVHLYGSTYGMRFALPIMQSQGRGRIIQVLSRAAEVSGAGDSAYSAAKAGMWAALRSAARDMPMLQAPDVVYPTALMLATLPTGGPTGRVFWNEREYALMNPANPTPDFRKDVVKP